MDIPKVPKERLTVLIAASMKQAIIKEASIAGQNLSTWIERVITKHFRESQQ